MSALWYKEWREFAPTPAMLLLRILAPLLLLGPLVRVPRLSVVTIAVAAGLLGATATASQVARERYSGVLPRLGLSPHPPATLLLHRVLSRSLLTLAQIVPLLLLAPRLISLAPPLVLAACAGGTWVGLRAPSRRIAVLGGLAGAAVAGLVAAQLPVRSGQAPAILWTIAVLLTAAALFAAPAILATRSD